MASSLLLPSACLALLLLLSSSTHGAGNDEPAVVTLDAGNFSTVVAVHQFIVVKFYAPWCYWSKKLAPEYEKAASILCNHEPPIILAEIDASGKKNKDFREKYGVVGYPTVKFFFRNGGRTMQEDIWVRDAESIVQYMKKKVGPASTEIKSAETAVPDGTLEPYHNSVPIPEVSDQPVNKVAPNNLHGVIFNSAKKVLAELRGRMK